jgi:hypothetical protein
VRWPISSACAARSPPPVSPTRFSHE